MAKNAGEPAAFAAAATQVRDVQLRRELATREIKPPERIAPHSIAVAASIARSARQAIAAHALDPTFGSGRFLLLYDPSAAEEWGGEFRVVCFAQAPLEQEIGVDPFISDVAWSWLADALERHGAEYRYLSGTATKTLSSGFGTLAPQGDAAQIELRASWTPQGTDFAAHVIAWSELLCTLGGLPHHEGIESIAAHRARTRGN
ncbi:DUF3000 domain-containing protein [Leucobacter sp. HY1908]